jgi:hypothetical protein
MAAIEARFAGTAAGTTAGVTVTQTAPTDANDKYFVTGVQCSGDAAAIVTVESPASTILWRKQFAAAFQLDVRFGGVDAGAIEGAAGQAILTKISASTAFCHANQQGVRV